MIAAVHLEKGELTRLAQITGASLTHLHFVLRGERRPSRELAQQIADFLHQDPQDLFPAVFTTGIDQDHAAGETQVRDDDGEAE